MPVLGRKAAWSSSTSGEWGLRRGGTISRLIPAALLRACAVTSRGHAADVGGFGHLCHSSLPPVPTLDSMILMGPFPVGILDVSVMLCSHSQPHTQMPWLQGTLGVPRPNGPQDANAK